MNKKIIAILHSNILLSWPYESASHYPVLQTVWKKVEYSLIISGVFSTWIPKTSVSAQLWITFWIKILSWMSTRMGAWEVTDMFPFIQVRFLSHHYTTGLDEQNILLNLSWAQILIRCPTLNEHDTFYVWGILKFTFFRVRKTKGNLVRRQWIDVKFDVMGM